MHPALKYKIETHCHTKPVSSCGYLTPAELVEAYRDLGYSAVNLSNHFGPHLFRERSREEVIDYFMQDYYDAYDEGLKRGVKVYLSAEFRFDGSSNDYVLFGVTRKILERLPEYFKKTHGDLYSFLHSAGAAIFQAHPFRDGQYPAPPGTIDGMEGYNMHPGQSSHNEKALEYAAKHNMRISSGSDAHQYWHCGRGGIISDVLPEDGFGMRDLMLSGQYELIHLEDFNYEDVLESRNKSK